MKQHAVRQGGETFARDTQRARDTMIMCPMAKMCMGMTERRPFGFLLMVPGVLLIGLGVLIVIEPRILVWLIAMASILGGILLLMMASFIRKVGAQMRM